VVALDTNYTKDDQLEISAFSKAMDTIFVTAKIFPPYDPSPAMAHRPKLDKAEEESKKQAKDLLKA